MQQSQQSVVRLITTALPSVKVQAWGQLGVAVTNIAESISFYEKIGFTIKNEISCPIISMCNRGGMYIHLFQADESIKDGKNILMDLPEEKYPGHTHASFVVASVPAVKAYLDSIHLEPSGTRKLGERIAAYFVRDLDRTTIELENNIKDEENVTLGSQDIGYPQGMDHIGIRLSNPLEGYLWYAENLGFVQEISTYELNPNPLKNARPWIVRTETHCDINFIPNGNLTPGYNILTKDGVIHPGIVYCGFIVDDVDDAAAKLQAKGIQVVRDIDLDSTDWGLRSCHVLPQENGKSIFLKDKEHNLIRLIS